MIAFHWSRRAAGRGERAPHGRRAVQHVDRHRRARGAEGVSPSRGRGQPGARDGPLPHQPRLRERRRRCAAGTRWRASSSTRRSASPRSSCRRPRRLGHGARRCSRRPGARARRPRRARRGHRADAHRPGVGHHRPGLRARRAGRGGPRAADRDDRRGDRARLPRPACRRRGARPDRRPRRGDPRSPAAHVARRRRREAHPPPRRPAPRADAAHAGPLGRPRLRGRARAVAHRPAPQALAAARRRGDAAVVRLRRHGGEPPEGRGRARGLGGDRARALPQRLLHRGRRGAAAASEAAHPPAARDLRAGEGRLRAALRAQQQAGLGADPRRRHRAACSRSRST